MTEALSLMLWPLLACFVLVGIHAYLGIHVIARKVIFVDLALAQIAALGAVYGMFIGLSFEADPWWIKGVSVIFTMLGALVFSFTRTPDERVPHEAIIGIIYAAALSMTLLVTANLPHGGDEVLQMLSGNILWVTPKEVVNTALLYSLVGVVHLLFSKQFFLLSNDTALKEPKTLNIKLWDFLFYATFGLVVTSSVGIGGILLVFGYLVIPSVIGIMLAKSTRLRLMIGWGSGVIMSTLGVILSYYLELPSGPTIVVLLGLLLLMIALVKEFRHKYSRRIGLLHGSWIVIVATLLILTPGWYARLFHHDESMHKHMLTHNIGEQKSHLKHSLLSKNDDEATSALKTIKDNHIVELFADVVTLLSAKDDKLRLLAINVLVSLDQEKSRPYLVDAARNEQDVFLKIEIAQALLAGGEAQGLFILQFIMNHAPSGFAKDDAFMHLQEWLLDAPREPKALSTWLEQNRDRLRFDNVNRKYYIKISG